MPSFVREESSGSVRVFWLEKERLLEELKREAQRLARANPVIEKVILFGSLAEDKAVPGSDIDLLLVLSQSDRPFLERIAEWRSKIHLDFPVDIFPYTVDELHHPLPQEAMKRGITLFPIPA